MLTQHCIFLSGLAFAYVPSVLGFPGCTEMSVEVMGEMFKTRVRANPPLLTASIRAKKGGGNNSNSASISSRYGHLLHFIHVSSRCSRRDEKSFLGKLLKKSINFARNLNFDIIKKIFEYYIFVGFCWNIDFRA